MGAVNNPPPISFSSQNVNSLNLTGSKANFDVKISSIKNLNTDVIFISDTRLVNCKGVSGEELVKTAIRDTKGKRYTPFFNSTKNSRGVGILLASEIDFVVNNTFKDQDENIIILSVTYKGSNFLIGSIYGPNNTCRNFYNTLRAIIQRNPNHLIVFGGDWNTVWDTSRCNENVDVFSMAGLPNPKNGEYLNNMCTDLGLTEPFRGLYPQKQEFSYSPFGTVRLNRSRLDFFICSASLLTSVTDCHLSPELATKLFDHKTVFLDINTVLTQSRKTAPRLRNTFLKDPYLNASVGLSSITCTVHSLLDGHGLKQELSERCKTMGKNLATVRKLQADSAILGNTINREIEIAGRLSQYRLFEEELGLLNLGGSEKRCNPSVFFEALCEAVFVAGCGAQKHLSRMVYLKQKKLVEEKNQLSVNFEDNHLEIFKIEKELTAIKETQIRDQMADMKVFEHLNAERASQHFLDLAKATKNEAELSDIRDAEGNVILEAKMLQDHITNFYRSLYRLDSGEPLQGEIHEFLGEEILHHPVVQGSILKEHEKLNLDQDLEILELDKSLDESNTKSAPGPDGFSYKFISAFWKIFRKPLFECAKYGLENNDLPLVFKTASIKLIPKKGNVQDIKNWRPISLLSNFYKIISRAINNRLKKVANRVLSRAQKGFNRARQLQEVILNTDQNISYCKKNNIKGVLVAIDQSKAFDSVGHSFMEKVYSFFGFGDKIRKWLATIGTGRTAKIILGGDIFSDSISLEKGHAQGDSPSPLLYNFAAQILLFKIELNPKIVPIRKREFGPIQYEPCDPFVHESNRETSTCECFADDNSTFTLLCYNSLNELKRNMEDFRKISGLSCNLDKTFIMRIGDTSGEIPENILGLGFNFVEKVKILGFEVSNTQQWDENNIQNATNKVRKLVRFWSRFRLSLIGKITIYKTLLMPQINFLSTIIMPTSDSITELETLMNNFVTQGMTIAKSRLYTSAKNGGLGLFDLRQFISALQSTWIKRAYQNCNDNWKFDLRQMCNGNILNINKTTETQNCGPLLGNIIKSFNLFQDKFTLTGKNFLKTIILGNEKFGYGRNMANKFTLDFFGNEIPNGQKNIIEKLTWGDLTKDNTDFETKLGILGKTGLILSQLQYNNLKNGYEILLKKVNKEGNDSVSMSEFLKKTQKGSKIFRKIITGKCHLGPTKLVQYRTYCKLTDNEEISEKRAIEIYSDWSNLGGNNRFNTFLFKMCNNTLGLNSRVNKFNAETDPSCTFCNLANIHPAPLETFSHLFYDCVVVNEKIGAICRDLLLENNVNKKNFFSGELCENEKYNSAFALVMNCLRFCIWELKLEKRTPTLGILKNEIFYCMKNICNSSKKYKQLIDDCQLFRQYGE